MHKALFLDRDGVINRERGQYTWRKEDFVLTPGIVPFLQAAQARGYLLIVITNQGGIAKHAFSDEDLQVVHDYMRTLLAREGIRLTDIYYCPHHDSVSKCLCRKPGTLMFEKAAAQYGIDPKASLYVGDYDRDEEAGRRAGIPTLRIASNEDLTPYISMLS